MRLSVPEPATDTDESIDTICIFLSNGERVFCERLTLTRWSPIFDEVIDNDRELFLADGFHGNHNELNHCISLLKGDEVDVTFDNVQVITKFAIQFKIKKLIDELKYNWYKHNLNIGNFEQVLKIVYDVDLLGFPMSTNFCDVVVEFVNDCSGDVYTLIEENFDTLDTAIIKTLLVPKNQQLDKMLKILSTKMVSRKQCELSIVMLSDIFASDYDVLLASCSEVSAVIERITNLAVDRDMLKGVAKLANKLFEISRHNLPSYQIGLTLLRKSRCWRKYSVKELIDLQKNPEVEEWIYVEMVIDWMKQHGPQQDVTIDLLNSLSTWKLSKSYENAIKDGFFGQILAFSGTRTPRSFGSWTKELRTTGMLQLTQDHFDQFKSGVITGFTFKCNVHGCSNVGKRAVVSLQLSNSSGIASLRVIGCSQHNENEHEHAKEAYKHWYMTSSHCHFFSLFTHTYSEIIDILDEHHSNLFIHALTVNGPIVQSCSIS